jgi:hypothetical protein
VIGGDGNGRNIEIPGYNIIGEKKSNSKLSFADFYEILSSLDSSIDDELTTDTLGLANLIKKGGYPNGWNDTQKNRIKEIIAKHKEEIKQDINTILKMDDSILEFILTNLYEDTNNVTPIKTLANNILQIVDESDDISIQTILDNLSKIVKYGYVLRKPDANKIPKYISLFEQLNTIKDTSIFLSETGVKTGDSLLIKIKNDEREFDIKILIKEFGWKVDLTDSYLYVLRQGDSMYTPMQGVTLSRSYLPRKGSKDWKDIIFCFTPGFGINVSFPQVGVDNNIQISTGLVLSLFDNAIFFTYGCDLTTAERKPYFGLGFSFVDMTKK